jgi:hypothetical protein
MALISQGCKLRRQATAAGSTAVTNAGVTTAIDANTDNTSFDWHAAAGDFTAAGFTTAMRIWTDSTLNQNAYTAEVVAATRLTVLGGLSSSTGLSQIIRGAAMSDIGGITGFSFPSGAPAVLDVSNLDSVAKQKLIGIVDEGQYTFDFNVESTDHIQWTHLKTDRANRTKRTWDIVFSDATKISASGMPSAALFDGYVTNYSVTAGVDAPVKGNVTIEIDGPVRWSTGVAS